MGWRESGIQIISALIGSSLVLTSLSGLYSSFNQPNIYIGVQHQLLRSISGASDPRDFDPRDPPLQLYEIIARNDGRESAKDLRLSLFFYSNITDFKTVIFGEDMEVNNQFNDGIPSLLVVNTSRLSHNAIIVIRIWTHSEENVPYYISATYAQGSNYYSSYHFKGKPAEIATLPDVEAGHRDDVPEERRLLIILLILSAVSFAVALGYKKIYHLTHSETPKGGALIYTDSLSNKRDISFGIAVIILSSLLIFFVFEELPLSLLASLDLVTPTDVIMGETLRLSDIILSSIIFSVISFLLRGLIAYLVTKRLVGTDQQTYGIRNLKAFSLLIMGWPLNSITVLFFNQSINVQLTYLFLIMFGIEILRMSLLVIVVPRIKDEHLNTILNGMKYIAAVIVAITGIIYLSIFAMISNTDFFSNSSSKIFPVISTALIVIGILQLFLLLPTVRGGYRWQIIGIAINCALTIMWISSLIIIQILLASLPTQFLPIRPGVTLKELPSILPVFTAGFIIELLQISYVAINFVRASTRGKVTWDHLKHRSGKIRLEQFGNFEDQDEKVKSHVRKYTIIISSLVVSIVVIGIILGHVGWALLSSSLGLDLEQVFPRKTLTDQGNPIAVAVNPENNMVYVANWDSDTISVIDESNRTNNDEISVGKNPIAVAVNSENNMVYVANWGSDTVSVIDGNTSRKIANDTSVGDSPNSLAVNPENNMVYVANWDSDTISVIDGNTSTKIANDTSVGKNPIAVAVNPENNRVYVANWGSDTISVIDGSNTSRKLVKDINVGASPNSLAVNPENNMVYAAVSDHISLISDRNAVDNINFGGLLEDMAFTRNTIFVVDTANMRILLIDPATSRLKDEIAANFNPDIEDIALNPNSEVIYLATGYDVSQISQIS